MTKTETKYLRATHSSHLEMRRTDEGQGDIETIVAAGLSDAMGILLTRLKGEWDAAAGEVSLTQRNAKRMQEARSAAVKAATKDKPFDAAAFDKAASTELLTARALILMSLRSLEPAKQSLFLFAHRQAPHKACDSDEKALAALVGQVLDVWLDKVCHKCEGRGFNGGYGSPRIMCVSPKHGGCGGSGSRRDAELGANPTERLFGLFLLNVMDSRVAGSMKTVQRKTRRE